jgi:GT2 family glycosyltransferase/glycosyltransferase involved in cell wall biosynthesis
VVVLNWNSAWFTRRCVRALLRSDYPSDRLEIVLVDNGSIDGSLEQLRASFPDGSGVRILPTGANLGFAEGCNRAIRELLTAGFEYVALVNNDAWVEPDWVSAMVSAMEARPRAGAASARLVLEPGFAALDVEAVPGGRGVPPVVVESVTLVTDGERLDVTAAVRTDGFYDDGALEWPARRRWRMEGERGRIWVPAGPGDASVELLLSGAAGRVTASIAGTAPPEGADSRTTTAVTDAEPVAILALGPARTVLLNGLGTRRNVVGEGYDVGYGQADASELRAELAETPVQGFCGGGALLRAAALREVGLLDPAFFAYYEDTDLSWRMTNVGWEVIAVPDAVIHHAYGGSGGGGSRLHVFLDRRNWLLTNLRSGTAVDRRRVVGAWWRGAWRLFRTNVFGKVRRGQAPQWEPVLTWKLGLLSALAHLPRLRTGLPGALPTDRVRSRFQPVGGPGAPKPRPGGPLVVYVDVGETLKAGYRAGIQRVVCALVASMPDADERVEVVPIRHEPRLGRFRRLTSAETDSLLRAGLAPTAPDDSPATASAKQVLRTGLGRLGVLAVVRAVRERVFGRRRRAMEDSLALDRLEAGAVLFEVDAVWNELDVDRAELLGHLRSEGVGVAVFVHDLLPLEQPEWFSSHLREIFDPTVLAQLHHAQLVLCASSATAESVQRMCRTLEIPSPPTIVVPLGSELAGDTGAPDRDQGAGGARPSDVPWGAARYLLVVGTLEPRKNQLLALEVFDSLQDEFDDLQLVLAGRYGWGAEELARRLERHPLAGTRVHWLSDVHDHDLELLYRDAFVVLVPSRSEGFGLPAVEALARGVPVIASSGGGVPEAAGDAAELLDPDDVAIWSARVRAQLAGGAAREEALRRAAAFRPLGWASSAAAVDAALVDGFTHPHPSGST